MAANLISIIVPVYNTEKYLDQCIQSVLAQTYANWELLLVDDGSTDSSGVICDKYTTQDSRIRVFHKKNGGVSSARNLGLDNAQGEWIAFVDADDWISPIYLHTLMKKANADLVVCACIFELEEGSWSNTVEGGLFSQRKLGNFIENHLLNASLTAPWCKVFRKKTIDDLNLRFDTKINYAEDTLFVLKFLVNCSVISSIDIPLYYYNNKGNSSSLTNKYEPYQKYFYSMDELAIALSQCSKRHNFKPKKAYLHLMLNCFVRQIKSLQNSSFSYNDLMQILSNNHCKNVVDDRCFLQKGRRRKCFDFFVRAKANRVIVLILKLSHCVY